MNKLSHLDEAGAARMVDISAKPQSEREARAESIIVLSAEAFEAVMSGAAPKGDVLAAARIAGIMAAKKTSELIPLCHPLALTSATVEFEPLADRHAIRILATAKTSGQTGVEMEALTAVSIAALTVYDMIKAVDKSAVIENTRLISKSGGKSGDYSVAKKHAPFVPKAQTARGRATPSTLMGEVWAPRADPDARRDAFRAFMTANRLQPTIWAKDAGVQAGEILGFLTGKSRGLSADAAERLARAAKVRVEDMFS